MKRTKLIHLTKHRNVLEYIILAMLIYLYVSEHSAGTKTSFILVNDLVKFETCYKQNNVRLIRRGKKYRQKQDLKKKKTVGKSANQIILHSAAQLAWINVKISLQ